MIEKIRAWFEDKVLVEVRNAIRPQVDPDKVPDDYWNDRHQ